MICASCGATAREGSAFCGSCGRPIIGYSVGQGSMAVAGGGSIAAGMPMAVSTGDTGNYAGFWLRFVAVIIDGLVLAIPCWIIGAMVLASAFPVLARSQNNPGLAFAVILPRIFFLDFLLIAVAWVYSATMESSAWQATLGKKALGLYVTDMEGNRISFARASGRHFGKIISGMILYVGFIMAGFTEKKQALHDMIASCLVQRNA
jgi:uncharacterized RDD family membrane protein YckC